MSRRIVVFTGSLLLLALVLWLIIRANKGGSISAVQLQPAPSVSTQVVLNPPPSAADNWKVVVTLPKTATNSPSTNAAPTNPKAGHN